jgi:hypothetical protein
METRTRNSLVVTGILITLLVGLIALAASSVSIIQHDLRGSGQCEGWHVCIARLHNSITILRVLIAFNIAGVVAIAASDTRWAAWRWIIVRTVIVLIVVQLVAAVPIAAYTYGKPG